MKEDVDFFRADLWKDLRPFPVAAQPDEFAKDCFEDGAARLEATVLQLLRARIGGDGFPEPLRVEDQVLFMRRVRGIRLFDLIRHLRITENEERDGRAARVLDLLLGRCRERLQLIQQLLFENRHNWAKVPYPLEQKLFGLLGLFVRVLDIRPPEGWAESIRGLVGYWNDSCSVVPFRDATTKNMIFAEPSISAPQDVDDVELFQRACAAELVDSKDDAYWCEVPIVDFDFSSITHLTSPEDDPVSLHCHEWTFGTREIRPENFLLEAGLGDPDPYRLAATFVVRYLRFGGRKLAYRLINAQGFKVRFAYDDPLFYFDKLPTICAGLSVEFERDFKQLLELIQRIADAVHNPSPSDAALLSTDYLRMHYPGDYNYWQQNPGRP